jgi:hypothetical protein
MMGVISLGPGTTDVPTAIHEAEEAERLKPGVLAVIGSAFVSDPLLVKAALQHFGLQPHTVINEPLTRQQRTGVAFAVERWFELFAEDDTALKTINYTGSPNGIRNQGRNRRVAKKSGAILIMLAAETPYSSEFVDAIVAAKAYGCKVYIFRTTADYNTGGVSNVAQ